jgi:hypothetical protein
MLSECFAWLEICVCQRYAYEICAPNSPNIRELKAPSELEMKMGVPQREIGKSSRV